MNHEFKTRYSYFIIISIPLIFSLVGIGVDLQTDSILFNEFKVYYIPLLVILLSFLLLFTLRCSKIVLSEDKIYLNTLFHVFYSKKVINLSDIEEIVFLIQNLPSIKIKTYKPINNKKTQTFFISPVIPLKDLYLIITLLHDQGIHVKAKGLIPKEIKSKLKNNNTQ